MMTTDALSQHFISPDPDQVIELLLENQPNNVLENTTLVYTISNLKEILTLSLPLLEASRIFFLVCATLTVSGPVDKAL
jgi:hypothetical protein